MVEADFSGKYIKYDSTEDGDIMEFLDEGVFEYNEALTKDMFNMKVKINGKEKVYSPTDEAGRALQAAFGKDTKAWIGKKAQIVHSNKKMLVRPLKEEKV